MYWSSVQSRPSIDQYMAAYKVSGVIVLKDGQIVLERYGLGRKPSERWVSQSVAKSITSLLAGAAIQDGKLALDHTVERHVPELKGSAYEGVTLRQLLTMSSGVKWVETYLDPNSDLARMGRLAHTDDDPLVKTLAGLPRAHPPGSTFHYNTAETHLAGLVISRAVGEPLSDYLSEKIWRPFGMEQDAIWMIDNKGREAAGCCISATLRDFARVGQFALENGWAGGKRVTPPGWIAARVQIRHERPLPTGYGYFWWLGARAYEASGIYGQSILVYPEERIVIAVNSAYPLPDPPELWAALQRFQGAVFEAATAP
jgi:CubicO group peptidase (beta-lactamase class C family)